MLVNVYSCVYARKIHCLWWKNCVNEIQLIVLTFKSKLSESVNTEKSMKIQLPK